ncbi:protein HEXIM1 isoform X1 [Microplitis demolitor]|uniref:protein HEXIM1 isoform X1 n=2 Tax=Microplitis demolitor TaxID=69319 RepID=UPI0004CCCF0F|nr:protein HEXIM1 isoform X1 [Microplitis demolitor]
MEETSVALSADEEMNLSDRLENVCHEKNPTKSSNMDSQKFESGSGSGDHEMSHLDDGTDTLAKKRKTRRGKPKHRKIKPYRKQESYNHKLRVRSNSSRVIKKRTQPPAPYNTTQFLMEDHSDLPNLEQKLAGTNTEVPKIIQKPLVSRTRDSSFSIDSDEDYFYSSPEDEEEFLTKEFSSAYEDLHAERLSALSKSELIQEYIQLEAKLDILTKRLRSRNFQQTEEKELDNKISTTLAADSSEFEMAKKLKICQQRIDDLIQQNDQLRRDLETLRGKRRQSSISSVDSESDSDSSGSCSCSESNGSTHYQSARHNVDHKTSGKSAKSGDNTEAINISSSSPTKFLKSISKELTINSNTTTPNAGVLPT